MFGWLLLSLPKVALADRCQQHNGSALFDASYFKNIPKLFALYGLILYLCGKNKKTKTMRLSGENR